MSDRARAGLDKRTLSGHLQAPQYIRRPTAVSRPEPAEPEPPSLEDVLPGGYDGGGVAAVVMNDSPFRRSAVTAVSTDNVDYNADENFDIEPIGLPSDSGLGRFEEAVFGVVDRVQDLGRSMWGARHDRHAVTRAALLAMATLVLVIGIAVSLQTSRANRAAATQLQSIYDETGYGQ